MLKEFILFELCTEYYQALSAINYASPQQASGVEIKPRSRKPERNMGKIILAVVIWVYFLAPAYTHGEEAKLTEEELTDESLIKRWRTDIIPLERIDRHICNSPVLNSAECSKAIASKKWKEFKNTYQKGDEVWFYCSPAGTWENLMGSQGYAIFRNDKLIKSYTTLMN